MHCWKVKIWSYIFYAAGSDIESQRKGLVLVTWPFFSEPPSYNFTTNNKDFYRRFMASTPIRFCAIHCCLPDTLSFRMVRPFVAHAACASVRSRLRFYVGEFRYHHSSLIIKIFNSEIQADKSILDLSLLLFRCDRNGGRKAIHIKRLRHSNRRNTYHIHREYKNSFSEAMDQITPPPRRRR